MKPMFLAFFAALALASCATTSWPTSADASGLSNMPDRFRAVVVQVERPVEGTCLNPLEDPRDGARLTLMRSNGGLGDYSAPRDAYGVGAGEWLRIDCRTGQAVGRVRGDR